MASVHTAAGAGAETPVPPAPAFTLPSAESITALVLNVLAGVGITPQEQSPPPVSEDERDHLTEQFRKHWPHLTQHALNPGGTEFSGLEDRGDGIKQLNIVPPVIVRKRIAEEARRQAEARTLPSLAKAGRS